MADETVSLEEFNRQLYGGGGDHVARWSGGVEVLSQEEIDQLLTAINTGDTEMEDSAPQRYKPSGLSQNERFRLETAMNTNSGAVSVMSFAPKPPAKPFTIKEFEALMTKRGVPERPYKYYDKDVTMCRLSSVPNGEELLADIERRNREEGMGNYHIPNTKITLINYSVCPKCGKTFSFKDLSRYYSNPVPDPLFKNASQQARQDTRMRCDECGDYFLPALIISDGAPKNEVQFLCRIQTLSYIEDFYAGKSIPILSRNKACRLYKEIEDTQTVQSIAGKPEIQSAGEKQKQTVTALRNTVELRDLSLRPSLIANLLQYTPAPLTLNLIEGTNVQNRDILYGAWVGSGGYLGA